MSRLMLSRVDGILLRMNLGRGQTLKHLLYLHGNLNKFHIILPTVPQYVRGRGRTLKSPILRNPRSRRRWPPSMAGNEEEEGGHGGSLPTLHEDILGELIKHLNLCDFVSFAAVCTSWRSAAVNHGFPSAARRPWLYYNTNNYLTFPERKAIDPHYPLSVYSTSPSKGWLIVYREMMDEEMILYHPLRFLAFSIPPPFPVARSFPPPVQYDVNRTILSKKPTDDPHWMIALATFFPYQLMVFRSWTGDWTTIKERLYYEDIIFCNNRLYALAKRCVDVYSFDGAEPSHVCSFPRPKADGHMSVLTESRGKVLIAAVKENKASRKNGAPRARHNISVLEVPEDNNASLIKIESLGNRTLFISGSGGICVEDLDISKLNAASRVPKSVHMPLMAYSPEGAGKILVKSTTYGLDSSWFTPDCNIQWKSKSISLLK